MAEFVYAITEPIAVLADNGRSTLELNMVSFNGKPAKLDIRRWQSDGNSKIMRKGIALDDDEAEALYEALKTRFGG